MPRRWWSEDLSVNWKEFGTCDVVTLIGRDTSHSRRPNGATVLLFSDTLPRKKIPFCAFLFVCITRCFTLVLCQELDLRLCACRSATLYMLRKRTC